MPKYSFFSRWGSIISFLMLSSCGRDSFVRTDDTFVFSVLDVGQGLSQIGIRDSGAIVWDMGPQEEYAGWKHGYRHLNSPFINTIVLSHSDADHIGGMARLDSGLAFSGLVIVSPFEDTAYIRKNCGYWKNEVRFKTKVQGDTLGGLENVLVECIWPPADIPVESPVAGREKNLYSLCFLLRFGNSTVMITSDIDTVAERELARTFEWGLKADVIVVPHHGSSGSVDLLFYGYVSPSEAVVSCSRINPYGHPAEKVLDLLFQMNVNLFLTYEEGHVIGTSNGKYWTWATVDAP